MSDLFPRPRILDDIRDNQYRQAALSATIGEAQIQQLRSIKHTMDALVDEMGAIRETQAEGLALQQATLARDLFQDKLEEFVYQCQKLIADFRQPESKYPPSTQYFMLHSMFEEIDGASISTAVIKGRDNKAAFDDCVSKGKAIYQQLESHPEVRKAIALATLQEEEKRRNAAAKKALEEQIRGKHQLLQLAVGMLFVGAMGLVIELGVVAFVVVGALTSQPGKQAEKSNDIPPLIVFLTMGISSGVSLVGAYHTLRLRSYRWSLIGSVAIMWGGLVVYFLGLAIGIRTLQILLRPNIKTLFSIVTDQKNT
jgi:hypothetical protein